MWLFKTMTENVRTCFIYKGIEGQEHENNDDDWTKMFWVQVGVVAEALQ